MKGKGKSQPLKAVIALLSVIALSCEWMVPGMSPRQRHRFQLPGRYPGSEAEAVLPGLLEF